MLHVCVELNAMHVVLICAITNFIKNVFLFAFLGQWPHLGWYGINTGSRRKEFSTRTVSVENLSFIVILCSVYEKQTSVDST